MSIFRRLFGTDKAIENLTDKDNGLLVRTGQWIDHFNYTEEERAKANSEIRAWGLDQLRALEPFKIVQRILAFSAMGVWAFLAFNVVIAIWVDGSRECLTGDTPTCIAYTGPMLSFAFSDYVFWPAISVLSFYMSGGVLPQLFQKKQ